MHLSKVIFTYMASISLSQYRKVLRELYLLAKKGAGTSPALFVGPTGVGKTEVIRSFAREEGIYLYEVSSFSSQLEEDLHSVVLNEERGEVSILLLDNLSDEELPESVLLFLKERKLERGSVPFQHTLVLATAQTANHISPEVLDRFLKFSIFPRSHEVARFIYRTTGCAHTYAYLHAFEEDLYVESEGKPEMTPRGWERVATYCCEFPSEHLLYGESQRVVERFARIREELRGNSPSAEELFKDPSLFRDFMKKRIKGLEADALRIRRLKGAYACALLSSLPLESFLKYREKLKDVLLLLKKSAPRAFEDLAADIIFKCAGELEGGQSKEAVALRELAFSVAEREPAEELTEFPRMSRSQSISSDISPR